MGWVRLDDSFYDHPKWVDADLAEIGLWAVLLAWSNRNRKDGQVPMGLPARYGAGPELVSERLARGVLEEHGGEYQIHGYLDWQMSAAQIAELSVKRADAGRKGGRSKALANAKQPASQPEAEGRRKTLRDTPNARSARPSFDDDFDALWAEYPRKVERKAALAAYTARRRANDSHDGMVLAVKHYAKSVQETDIRFVKHCATFLAKDGPWTEWRDGPPGQTQRPKPRVGGLPMMDAR